MARQTFDQSGLQRRHSFSLAEKTPKASHARIVDAKGAGRSSKPSSRCRPEYKRLAEQVRGEEDIERIRLNLHLQCARRIKGLILWGGQLAGPKATPGEYQVQLTAGDSKLTERFSVKKDPRLATTQADFDKQFALLSQIRDKLFPEFTDDVCASATCAPSCRPANEQKNKSAADAVKAAEELSKDFTAMGGFPCGDRRTRACRTQLNYPHQLDNKLAARAGVVGGSNNPADRPKLHRLPKTW
ncbi:MAG: hypothetical protein U5J83_00750 [Bryobacterales bacterium]|nr:hypothetical protein [Bryobacterales bacterium]